MAQTETSENGHAELPEFKDVEIDLLDDELMRRQALDLLQRMRPQWHADDTEFKTFTNGITNRIFCVTHTTEPKERLIFRVFGKNTDKVIDRVRELDTIRKLEKAGIAAPLHAKFSNGIVCGYLEGETLDPKTVREPQIIDKICKAMAAMHKIPLDPSEKPFIFAQLDGLLNELPSRFQSEKHDTLYRLYFGNNNLREQFEHLCQLLSALNNPVVFCHNDLLVYNILFDQANDKVNFIDYEFANANYQLFDIANHFNEYAGVDEPNYSLCPTKAEKREFLRVYLTHYLQRNPTDAELTDSLEKVPFFEAASHFYWAIWAIIQAANSTLDFDYMKYAVLRHNMFAKVITKIG